MLYFSCKNTFVGAGNVPVITSKFLIWILMGALCNLSGPSFVHGFGFLEDEAYNLRSWLHQKELAY